MVEGYRNSKHGIRQNESNIVDGSPGATELHKHDSEAATYFLTVLRSSPVRRATAS